MQYLPLFLLFLAVLIAAWFYLQRAKLRGAGTRPSSMPTTPSRLRQQPATPVDRPE